VVGVLVQANYGRRERFRVDGVPVGNLIGERIFPDLSISKQTIWGTACLSLACALPFVGWFLLLPYVGLTGIGAVILGFLQSRTTS